ncbi:cell division protein ZapA [Glaesserella parasuis]|nr:cell division protein ZapA [Glaesserella parasuis]
MSKNNIELSLFGQVLRFYSKPEQQDALLASGKRIEDRDGGLIVQSGIIHLDKVLSIVALNLNYELEQEQRKNAENKNVLMACVEQLDSSLAKFQSSGMDSVSVGQENNE